MTEKTLTTENIKPALDALRGELAPWPVVAKKQDRLNTAQLNAANSGITSSLVAQIIANTAAIRALESAITGTGLRALVVATLPAVGTTGILYIVPVTTYDPETDADVVNYSNEYIWIPVEAGTASEGHYEQVGQTGIVINNGQLTITVNGTSVGTFTANQSGDTTAAITVPTNADYVDRTTDQTVAGDKTWTGEQSFTLPIVGSITGTASKAIADEDGTSIKTGYVNIAGNQTVSGQKTWTGSNTFTSTITTKTNVDRAVAPTSDTTYGTIICRDKNNSAMFRMQGTIKTDLSNVWDMMLVAPDNSYITFFKYTISAATSNRELRFKADSVIPDDNSTSNLGSSSYQWKSVYAQNYYYNGTAFTDKFVTIDTIQDLTANKGIATYNATLALHNTQIEIGTAPAYQRNSEIFFGDKNHTELGRVLYRAYTNGTRQMWLAINDKYANGALSPTGTTKWNNLLLNIDPTEHRNVVFGTDDVIPSDNNATNLGTSSNKWKTLNGVNPGGLSLPTSSYVEIDTTNWDLTGATSQSYTPAVHGWLYIAIQNIAGNYLSMAYRRGAVSIDGTGVQSGLKTMLPVVANESVSITVKTGSIFAARFYPCLGNV